MATFFKFGKVWDIPPAAARLGASLPANTRAFDTFLTNLEPMYSAFISAHPRCPKDPDLLAIRNALKQFMEEWPISRPFKERWRATYDPAKKVTWYLTTISYFLDKLDFSSLPPAPPVHPARVVDPFPSPQPAAPSSPGPAAKPVRQSRLWHAGGPAGLAALEQRSAAERPAQLPPIPRDAAPEQPDPAEDNSEILLDLGPDD
jgi:hypothetical protein